MVIFNNANTVFPVGCIFLFGTRKAFKNIKMEISQVIKQRLQVAYNSYFFGGKLGLGRKALLIPLERKVV